MSDLKTFRLYDANTGLLKADATPSVLFFGRTGAVRTPPAGGVLNIGGGVYGVRGSDDDVAVGTAFLVTGGAGVSPAHVSGSFCLAEAPFDALVFEDQTGALWAGAGPPPVTTYRDSSGNVLTPPPLLVIVAPYFYGIAPSSTELAVGVAYVVDGVAGTINSYDGAFSLPPSGSSLTITKASVLLRFGELDAEPALNDALWTELLVDVRMEVQIAAWASQEAADRAATWLIAHMVTLEKLRLKQGYVAATTPGQLQSVTVGPVTKTFKSATPATPVKGAIIDEQLERTEYGREYMRLRRLFCRSRS